MKLFTNGSGFDRMRAHERVVTAPVALTKPSYKEQGMADSQPIHAHAAQQEPPPNIGDLRGRTFSSWTVLGFVRKDSHGESFWLCRCECGVEKSVRGSSLRRGTTKSCSCVRIKNQANVARNGAKTTCFHLGHDLNLIWNGMHQRCSNPNRKCYPRYGGRGITVCERWNSFEAFLADMGERPSKRHSIERIDNNGNYEPGNCRWATRAEQLNNTRVNHRLAFNGRTQTIAEWAAEIGIQMRTLWARIKSGWSVEKALTTPLQNQGIQSQRGD